jgi:hypothetical protein
MVTSTGRDRCEGRRPVHRDMFVFGRVYHFLCFFDQSIAIPRALMLGYVLLYIGAVVAYISRIGSVPRRALPQSGCLVRPLDQFPLRPSRRKGSRVSIANWPAAESAVVPRHVTDCVHVFSQQREWRLAVDGGLCCSRHLLVNASAAQRRQFARANAVAIADTSLPWLRLAMAPGI